jgi:hypothetical protein
MHNAASALLRPHRLPGGDGYHHGHNLWTRGGVVSRVMISAAGRRLRASQIGTHLCSPIQSWSDRKQWKRGTFVTSSRFVTS